MSNDSPEQFHIAAFNMNGTLEGIGHKEYGDLSERWTRAAEQVLSQGGETFDYSWPFKLSHIRTAFASVASTASATFHVGDEIVSSLLLLKGDDSAAERQIIAIFAESLANSELVKALFGDSLPFEALLTIEERPLMVVVPWPATRIADQDKDLVRELSIHLAAAYFGLRPSAED